MQGSFGCENTVRSIVQKCNAAGVEFEELSGRCPMVFRVSSESNSLRVSVGGEWAVVSSPLGFEVHIIDDAEAIGGAVVNILKAVDAKQVNIRRNILGRKLVVLEGVSFVGRVVDEHLFRQAMGL